MREIQVLSTVTELRAWSRNARALGKNVGLVPTMGALHEGHLSLVRAAKANCEAVAVSIFVNPTQFGPNEDFSKYPRTWEADCALLESEKVDVIFAPAADEIYPPGACTFVEVEGIGDRLDGLSRPGHFRGVATVVAKLLIAAEPDRAYFGQKDAAQVTVLRRMVQDLYLPVDLIVCPIVREPDGLAMSSRNLYLSPEERSQAVVLHHALTSVEAAISTGERESQILKTLASNEFAKGSSVEVDYTALVDWQTLEPLEFANPGSLFAVAACIGKTRLIDNFIVA